MINNALNLSPPVRLSLLLLTLTLQLHLTTLFRRVEDMFKLL